MRELTETELDAVVGGVILFEHPGNVNDNANREEPTPSMPNLNLKAGQSKSFAAFRRFY